MPDVVMTYDPTNVGVIERLMELPTPEWMQQIVRDVWNAELEGLRDFNDNKVAHHMPWYVPDHDWTAHDISHLRTWFLNYEAAEWSWTWEVSRTVPEPPIGVSVAIDIAGWFDELGEIPETDRLAKVVAQYAKPMAYALHDVLLHPERIAVE